MSYLDLVQNGNESYETARVPVIFAASDITFTTRKECLPSDETIIQDGKCYRRLTPEYWAWFNHKYHLMEKALTHGKITEATFKEILDRISALYNHAISMFGKDILDEACRTTDLKEMDAIIRRENSNASGNRKTSPPSLVAERNSTRQKPAAITPASKTDPTVAKVDAIRDKAIALGWSRDQLYKTDGIAYRDWGLMRFLSADEEIGEITPQYIEIRNKRSGNVLRFYNQDAVQPWIRKSGETEDARDAVRQCG